MSTAGGGEFYCQRIEWYLENTATFLRGAGFNILGEKESIARSRFCDILEMEK